MRTKIPGIKLFLFSIFLSVLANIPCQSAQDKGSIGYELAVAFDIENQILTGTAHLVVPAGQSLDILLSEVSTTAVVLEKQGQTPVEILTNGADTIAISTSPLPQELFISYTKKITAEGENYITDQGITLLHSWYPFPSKRVFFSLSAQLPSSFLAVSESDEIPIPKGNVSSFSFSDATDTIHLVAAPFVTDSIVTASGVKILTYFYKEDHNLAKGYLRAGQRYIDMYEKSIGQYPFNHFAIVENMRPTGFGMPTFTLLGRDVIRLPFIKDTSLGHEILHSWFGNSVRVAGNSANWSEGLTSYLADWQYRELQGQGSQNRKENIIKYQNIISPDNKITLDSFHSASHRQHNAKAMRSVGYIRGAMFFHELRMFLGTNIFNKGIRMLYSRFRGKEASWSDIETVFEEASNQTLDTFFSPRLQAADILDLTIKEIDVSAVGAGYKISFTLLQNNASLYDFILPIRIMTMQGISFKQIRILPTTSQKVTFLLEQQPVEMIVDPDYDLLRVLSEQEKVSTWSAFLGPRPVTVLVADADKETYSPFLQLFTKSSWDIRNLESASINDLEKTNVIILGINNSLVDSLFGNVRHAPSGFTVDARANPLNKIHDVLMLSTNSSDEITKAARRLSHYGKYSFLHFSSGRAIKKEIKPGQTGLQFKLNEPPKAIASSEMKGFTDIIDDLQHAQVVYVGESHTSMTDHHLQLLVIKALHAQNPNIAIGMEMFPVDSQKALDAYILSDSIADEKDFLKQSEYFKVWRYDYRLYKKIIDFARHHSIPLLALNIDRDIVSSVFKNGSYAELSEQQLKILPKSRDLSLPGYYERLRDSLNLHIHGGHSSGGMSGFIQAQALWDEAMADNIAGYLRKNFDKKLIVLAGSQHTRKDNGIPPRVERRLTVNQKILQTAPAYAVPPRDIADYFIFLDEQLLSPAGKIGVSLLERSDPNGNYLTIESLSPESNAKDSGLKQGDRLISINGFPTLTMDDVKIGMAGLAAGDNADIEIERSSEPAKVEKRRLTIKLYDPTAAAR